VDPRLKKQHLVFLSFAYFVVHVASPAGSVLGLLRWHVTEAVENSFSLLLLFTAPTD
jgi:hypothetical protein